MRGRMKGKGKGGEERMKDVRAGGETGAHTRLHIGCVEYT